jgi:hypothetical protein
VETAIVMPLFVFLILGIIQLSLMHQARSMTKYAAFRAVRAGSMENASPKAMERAAWDVLEPLVKHSRNAGQRHVEVVICAPTRPVAQRAMGNQPRNQNLSFDYPLAPGVDFEARKLAVQVTFHYPLFIPFADMLIYSISRGQEAARAVVFRDVVRMGTEGAGVQGPRGSQTRIQELESGGTPYVVPIRANYALRLQSDVPLNRLPTSDGCVRL